MSGKDDDFSVGWGEVGDDDPVVEVEAAEKAAAATAQLQAITDKLNADKAAEATAQLQSITDGLNAKNDAAAAAVAEIKSMFSSAKGQSDSASKSSSKGGASIGLSQAAYAPAYAPPAPKTVNPQVHNDEASASLVDRFQSLPLLAKVGGGIALLGMVIVGIDLLGAKK